MGFFLKEVQDPADEVVHVQNYIYIYVEYGWVVFFPRSYFVLWIMDIYGNVFIQNNVLKRKWLDISKAYQLVFKNNSNGSIIFIYDMLYGEYARILL